MSSTGAILPQAAVSYSYSNWIDNAWSNPANVYGAGEAEVISATYDAGDQTELLKAYNFDFSVIPDGATINGVVVIVNARYATVVVSIDHVALLSTLGAPSGDNKAATPTELTTSAANYTFGAADNLWGNALTPAWVKDPR